MLLLASLYGSRKCLLTPRKVVGIIKARIDMLGLHSHFSNRIEAGPAERKGRYEIRLGVT